MSIQEDETLRLYVEESVEHLANIENDLLAIEQGGADIDEELVNKVFRAAHSIKGGAGFMGLNNIKELSHRMENVLGMIREREMVPNSEVINILLLASDTLRNLLNDVGSSNKKDISAHIEALTSLSMNTLAGDNRREVSDQVDICLDDGKTVFSIPRHDILTARKKGNYIYLLEFDLIDDIHKRNQSPLDLLKRMEESGVILECKVDIQSVGKLEDDMIPNRIPFVVLFGTILEPGMVNALFDIDEKCISELDQDFSLRPLGEGSQVDEPVTEQETKSVEEEFPTAAPAPVIDNTVAAFENESFIEEQAKGKKNGDKEVGTVTDGSLRVNVSLLDSLMNLAGELVLGRNQLLQAIALKDLHSVDASGQRLDLITSELQEAIMMTRMQPIGNVFNKFPRVVRDLARDLGKEVKLAIDGEGVELDKTILEAINDPLTHLVRNSVDHGLESPEERRRAGKDPTGHVVLKAYHEAGQVNIDISDDGRGIDQSKLAATALAKNLITEEQAASMSDKEKINLIFLPGFSTAKKISDISGRGVGMDVVKTNLDKLGGVVEIDSTPGAGTTIKIKLPLTLAIIPSQLISVGGEKYAIPQVNLEELFRIPAAQVKDRIEKVGDAEVVRLRGNLLPLLRLADVIGVERTYKDTKDGAWKEDRRKNLADRRSRKSPMFYDKETEKEEDDVSRRDAKSREMRSDSEEVDALDSGKERRKNSDRRYHTASAVNIVVVYTGALKYGLVVDELHDSEEIVVKPLGRHLKHCKGYAGATIMGDGRVALILDVAGLSQMAELTSLEGTDRVMDATKEKLQKTKKDVLSLLLFRNAEEEQFAVPLGLVERIEKIKRSDIEAVGGKNVMQYRGSSLPLFAIEEAAKVKPLADKEDLLVIVFVIAGNDVGLLATPPLDAIEQSLNVDDTTLKQTGIMGSTIINDHTTLIVNIYGLVEALNPEWFEKNKTVKRTENAKATVLYAEDSNFFRNQVKEYLIEDEYNVIEAEDGIEAWDLLQKHEGEISLVVTDIEMPNLDGFGLVQKIKEDNRFSHLPIIALTTMAGEDDIKKGKTVGINDYLIKLDKEKLMERVHHHLSGVKE